MLTPQQLPDQTFRLVRHSAGHDIDEVHAFLDRVEGEVRRLHVVAASRGAG